MMTDSCHSYTEYERLRKMMKGGKMMIIDDRDEETIKPETANQDSRNVYEQYCDDIIVAINTLESKIGFLLRGDVPPVDPTAEGHSPYSRLHEQLNNIFLDITDLITRLDI